MKISCLGASVVHYKQILAVITGALGSYDLSRCDVVLRTTIYHNTQEKCRAK